MSSSILIKHRESPKEKSDCLKNLTKEEKINSELYIWSWIVYFIFHEENRGQKRGQVRVIEFKDYSIRFQMVCILTADVIWLCYLNSALDI